MGSPFCDDCNMGRCIVYYNTLLSRLCLQCDGLFHSVTVDNHAHSRSPLCNNHVSETAVVQCLDDKGCQTCVSNANIQCRFLLCNRSNSNSSITSSPDLDYSSSFIDHNFSFVSSIPPSNGDLSPSSVFFQSFDNYTTNPSDQQVLLLQPEYVDIPKDSSYSGFDVYDTKEEKVWMNNFDDEKIVLNLKEHFPREDLLLHELLIDEIKDYNPGALAGKDSQDYNKNEMIGSKAKQETNSVAICPKALVELDCEPSKLSLNDEMLPWEDQTLASPVYQRTRQEALQRYFEKKKKRKFGKQIRYESRKSTADTKRRMKGRFAKAGAEYDFDPRDNNINNKINKTRLNKLGMYTLDDCRISIVDNSILVSDSTRNIH